MKKYFSWNNFPQIKSKNYITIERDKKFNFDNGKYITYGLGKSYGDVCLNENENLIINNKLNKIIHFDKEEGVIDCESGVSFEEILNLIVKDGWFLPVVPGTRYITLGGAIANDIHGKNHHINGSFGNFVESFKLLRSDNEILECSLNMNEDYFKSTIGGIGLTGIILSARIRLIKINNHLIKGETIRFLSLDEYWEINDRLEQSYDYVVSWVDCKFDNDNEIRGVIHGGNHSEENIIKKEKENIKIKFPFTPPFSFVNNLTMKIINEAYFRMNKNNKFKEQTYKSFFFPLDSIISWNRAYGRKGFFQYQFVVPKDSGKESIKKVLEEIKNHKQIPALGVLKNFGIIPSIGILSFPREGITLALDFPNKGKKTLDLLNKLDKIIINYGGAVYPAKDARMSKEVFYSSFPNVDKFTTYIDKKFSSSFWRRVNK
tara:strand:- start:1722 stop:3017 length:1296 start_codon:yes stop_codon:yes gene_type:complete